jgi:ABC-2 type transport system ATP-binding protein
MLEAQGIQKLLGGHEVLDRVELCAGPAEVVVLTGENGSGKTTFLRIMAGLLEPSRGTVQICGHSLARQPVLAKTHLGYVPDGLEAVPELLVSEFCALVAALKASARGRPPLIDPAFRERLGLLPIWGQRLRSLSLGQRKRVALYVALIGAPSVLILDEPSNGLDPGAVDLMRALIEERRRAALLTVLASNDAEFANSFASTRYHLAAGKLSAPSKAAASLG